MNRMRKGFVGGVVTGAVIGTAMYMMINPIDKHTVKCMKKRTNKAMHAVGDFAESIVDNLR